MRDYVCMGVPYFANLFFAINEILCEFLHARTQISFWMWILNLFFKFRRCFKIVSMLLQTQMRSWCWTWQCDGCEFDCDKMMSTMNKIQIKTAVDCLSNFDSVTLRFPIAFRLDLWIMFYLRLFLLSNSSDWLSVDDLISIWTQSTSSCLHFLLFSLLMWLFFSVCCYCFCRLT